MFTVSARLIAVSAAFAYGAYQLAQGAEEGKVWLAAGFVLLVGYV